MKTLLTGNEAVALGAYKAGVFAATGYPGTPATEIIESIACYSEVYTEWSVNEKTALEFASGISLSGRRALVAMKHVGLNVASDPLMSLAYTGVNGGLVIAVSDDPGMRSSQNGQDSRLFGRIANIPVLEPSDSEEAYIFTKRAFEISENFDLPVILRLTRSISHTSTIVDIEGNRKDCCREYRINVEKNVLLPPFTSRQRLSLQKRIETFREFTPLSGLNTVEILSNKIGIITSGIAYQYVKDAVPEASVLKIGIVHPLNAQEIKEFSVQVENLFIIEESEPFVENAVRSMGIKAKGKADRLFPVAGELNTAVLREAFRGNYSLSGELCGDNHSSLCPGCPYLGVFYLLSSRNLFTGGDIGCYTLSVHTFPHVLDTTLCMGSGISQAAGYSISKGEKATAIIGDSTFFHSGIPAILNAIYHNANILVIVLDNHTTSMTGGQPHIGTGNGIRGKKKKVMIEDVLSGCGIKYIKRTGAYNLKETDNAINEGLSAKGVSVIIIDGECILKEKKKKPRLFSVDKKRCSLCGACLALGCEAIVKNGDSYLIKNSCNECGLCVQICEQNAIKKNISILFAGKGGQGVLTASSITARAFFLSGYDVKKSDIKGIARRGGRVLSTLIAGGKIYNPKVTPETSDIVVLLSGDHYLTFSDSTLSVAPKEEEVEKYRRYVNVFCLGKLSILLDIPLKNWEKAIRERFDNHAIQSNLRAFYEGKKAAGFMQ